MLENIGPRDRTIRTLLAIALAAVAVLWVADLRIAAPAALAAVSLAGTVVTRRCPLYCVLGLRTCHHARPPTGHSSL